MADPIAAGNVSAPGCGRAIDAVLLTPNGDIGCNIAPERCEIAAPMLIGLRLLPVSMVLGMDGSVEIAVGCSTEEPEEYGGCTARSSDLRVAALAGLRVV